MALPKTFTEGEVLTAAQLNGALEYLDKQTEALAKTTMADTGWVSPPVWGNSYVGYTGGGHQEMAYRLKDGLVQLAGAIRKSNSGVMDDKAIANMPPALRPRTTIEGANFFVKPDGNIFTSYRGSGAIHGNVMWFVG